MRVAVVTQYFPTSAQPWAGHSAYQTLRELARTTDLHVFYPAATYPRVLQPKSAKGTAGKAIDPAWQPADVAATYISYPVLPVVSRPLNGAVMASRLREAVRAYRPDAILNYVVYPDGFAAVQLGRALGVPVVLTAIGSDLNRIPGRLVERLTRTALRRAAAVTTVSHDLCRTAIRLGARAETARAILNGCDTTIFHPRDRAAARVELATGMGESLPPEAELVVYVGRLDLRKGLAELLDAAAALHASRPRLLVCLVGDGPDRPALEAQIARLDLTRVVRLVASCPTDRVAQWMAAADLVTLPSYMEGCPNVVLEALASGRPVVATRVGGIPELMDEGSGRLVVPRDAVALARGLAEVLDTRCDAGAIAGAHSRSWADVAEDLRAVLAGCLSKARAEAGKAGKTNPALRDDNKLR